MGVILVTGGTSGLGRALALYFGEKNNDVIITYRTSVKKAYEMRRLLKILDKNITIVRADATNENQVKKLIYKISKKFGKIDIIINNVGEIKENSTLNWSYKDWNKIISSNLNSAFLICKHGMKLMNKGSIINIGFHNVGMDMPFPNILPYAIGKEGVLMLTKTLSEQNKKISINMVSPGVMVHSKIGSGKIEFKDVINVIEYLINTKNVTGQNIVVTS